MTGLVRMSLDSPEETREFLGGTGQLQLVDIEEGGVGRATFMPAGHDAWVVGSEPCVVIDWQGFADYAKR